MKKALRFNKLRVAICGYFLIIEKVKEQIPKMFLF